MQQTDAMAKDVGFLHNAVNGDAIAVSLSGRGRELMGARGMGSIRGSV